MAAQLITALVFMHDRGIMHADLKVHCQNFLHSHCSQVSFLQPENILLAEAERRSLRIKVADFGNAMCGEEAFHYFDDYDVQSLPYRAPEVQQIAGWSGILWQWHP